jgi:glycosyltransferase involved in cell wall biosynthesis
MGLSQRGPWSGSWAEVELRPSMKLAVIIPTYGRGLLVNRLLAHLEGQKRLPDEVVISAPDESHVEPYEPQRLRVSYVFGQQGSSVQRNQALVKVLDRFELVTFFDDDFLPADNYLDLLVKAFDEHPELAVINGNVVRDGATGAGYTFEEGLQELRNAEAAGCGNLEVEDTFGAYGCNMSMRTKDIGDLRFDERLVLYGWQEDIDFTSQLRRFGRIVSVSTLLGVHLGRKVGKVSGVRFGYAQVINPVYLIGKGTMSMSFALELVFRNLAANLLRSVRPEPYIDRRGRLRGNMLALLHVLRGHIEPEYVLKL